MLVSSSFTEGPYQIDGRRWVREAHITDEGDELKYEWLGEQDAQMVLEERVALLNAQYAARAAARALVTGSLIPLSKLEFRNLFGASKPAVDAFNAGFESSPLLSAAQKAAIRSGLEDFREAKYIERPFRPDVLALIGLYQSIGILSAEQADAVRAAGNG
jgi:hypothetical protein